MCIIIDTNTLAPVFEPSCELHSEFKPVLDWITNGDGKLIYGGTEYKEEIPRKYIKIIRLLRDAARAFEIDEKKVDDKCIEISNLKKHRDFDDPHIVALIIVSNCRLICSGDGRAFPFFQMKSLYPNHFPRPKIYSKSSHRHLLCQRNIVKITNRVTCD